VKCAIECRSSSLKTGVPPSTLSYESSGEHPHLQSTPLDTIEPENWIMFVPPSSIMATAWVQPQCSPAVMAQPTTNRKGVAVLPYIKGVSECSRHILTLPQFGVCFIPHQTLRSLLSKPKNLVPDLESFTRSLVPTVRQFTDDRPVAGCLNTSLDTNKTSNKLTSTHWLFPSTYGWLVIK
jgi:hypothetical protein